MIGCCIIFKAIDQQLKLNILCRKMFTLLHMSRVRSIEREIWDCEIEEGDTCAAPQFRRIVHRGEHQGLI